MSFAANALVTPLTGRLIHSSSSVSTGQNGVNRSPERLRPDYTIKAAVRDSQGRTAT
jgi:hypothetical protein